MRAHLLSQQFLVTVACRVCTSIPPPRPLRNIKLRATCVHPRRGIPPSCIYGIIPRRRLCESTGTQFVLETTPVLSNFPSLPLPQPETTTARGRARSMTLSHVAGEIVQGPSHPALLLHGEAAHVARQAAQLRLADPRRFAGPAGGND